MWGKISLPQQPHQPSQFLSRCIEPAEVEVKHQPSDIHRNRNPQKTSIDWTSCSLCFFYTFTQDHRVNGPHHRSDLSKDQWKVNKHDRKNRLFSCLNWKSREKCRKIWWKLCVLTLCFTFNHISMMFVEERISVKLYSYTLTRAALSPGCSSRVQITDIWKK